MKKIIIPLLITIFIVFGIYNFYNEDKLNYVALGDSLAQGENPYGEIGYGYADYIKEYLSGKDKLKSYTKGYAKSGDTTEDLIDKIKNNVKAEIDNEQIGIKRALRESDLVTISIGANDLIQNMHFKNIQSLDTIDYTEIEKNIDKVTENVDKAITEIKKYAKKEILLIGYYNPINKKIVDNEKMKALIDKIDALYTDICAKQEIVYIKISDVFVQNDQFLPNPFNIHPNYKGYQAISTKIINYLEKNNKKLAWK
mgnify:CR=1 FL=1